MREFFKKNWKMIAFAAVILAAIFLRAWHFHDWLFFKMDQARDALLIKQVLENGPGWLPLLGPKAGGTHLNLGPAFYYFQYISAFLFQSQFCFKNNAQAHTADITDVFHLENDRLYLSF